jgi:ATP-dependent exoDNAse (exonuclease V) alpha subunit
MQVENNYDKEVYNGDLGVVSRIDMEEGELTVDFDGANASRRPPSARVRTGQSRKSCPRPVDESSMRASWAEREGGGRGYAPFVLRGAG